MSMKPVIRETENGVYFYDVPPGRIKIRLYASHPASLCGSWQDDRSPDEIVEDIYSKRLWRSGDPEP
jgi:hypothetical protein